jgi:hypothetical protein
MDTENDQTSSVPSTIREADTPVTRRLRIVVSQLTDFIQIKGDSRYARYGWLLDTLMTEVLDEIADNGKGDEAIGEYFAQFGRVIEWCGSGDDSVLPESVRSFLIGKYPDLITPLAIEA